MKIYYSPYQLLKKNKLNSSDRSKEQEGALIRLVEGDDWGVADLSPKIELCDATYKEQMNRRSPLFLRAIELARTDLEARRESRSLLSSDRVKNNILITNYKDVDLSVDQYVGKTLKIKADQNLPALTEALNSILNNVILRIDFNNCLSVADFSRWLSHLSPEVKKKIQYIEDPAPLNENWRSWNREVALAYDFQTSAYSAELSRYRIFKPTREAVYLVGENAVLTSAMEHPVGLAHGLRIAQQLKPTTVSGFLTLDLFQETDFHCYYQQSDHELTFTTAALNDSGIGMTTELERLDWYLYE